MYILLQSHDLCNSGVGAYATVFESFDAAHRKLIKDFEENIGLLSDKALPIVFEGVKNLDDSLVREDDQRHDTDIDLTVGDNYISLRVSLDDACDVWDYKIEPMTLGVEYTVL